MSSKNDKAEEIKDLAINGLFNDIVHKFGEKSLLKAKEYALLKLKTLKEKIAMGEDVINIKIATQFMIFAATFDEPLEIDKVSKYFLGGTELDSKDQGIKEEQEILTEPQDEIPPAFLEIKKSDTLPEPALLDPIESTCTENGGSSITAPLGEDVDMDAVDKEQSTFSPEEDVEKDTLEEKQLSSPSKGDKEIDPCEEIAVPIVVQSTKKSGFQIPVAPKSFVAPSQGSSNIIKRPIKEATSTKPNKSSTAKEVVAKSKKSSTSDSNKGKDKPISKKAKKAMFSNAPKSAMNSYVLFGETTRKEVLTEDPNMKVTDVMKEVGIRWRLLEAEEKHSFEERAREDKSRYITERADYFENFPEEAAEWENSSKKTKTSKDKSHDKNKKKKDDKGRGKKAASVSDGESGSEGDHDDENDFLAPPPDVRQKISRKVANAVSRPKEADSDEDDLLAPAPDVRQKVRKVTDETSGPKEADNDEDDHQDDFEDDDDEEAEANFTQSTPNPRGGSRPAVVSSSHPNERKASARKVPPSKRFKSNHKGKSSSSTSSSSLKSAARSDDPQRIPYIDPIAAAIIAAKTVSSLNGIKQTDLPFDEDLIKTKAVPFERCSFPTDFEPSIGAKVTLIPESYRIFIAELEPNLLTLEDVELIQDACSLQAALVDCVITASRPATPEQQSEQKKLESAQVLTLMVRSASGEGFDNYSMLYVPFSSPLLQTDLFLLDRAELKSSLKSSWLITNAQVRRIFAPTTGSGGIWVEGSIYHIRQDMKSNPYNSISVVDQQQEKGPLTWFYSYDQTQILCSPWDLQMSNFVRKAESVPLPRTLAIGQVTAEAVLKYLKCFDFFSVFCYRLTDNAEYCKMFPRKDDRLDLHVISSRCKKGNYEGKDGVNLLFEDLEAMCLNGKKFNDSNKNFQPWTFVDMAEKTISDLQLTLGSIGKLKSRSSRSQDSGADGIQERGGLMAALDEAEEDQENEGDEGEERDENQEDCAAKPVTTISRKRRSESSLDAGDAGCSSQQDKRRTPPMSQKEQDVEMEVEEV